MNAEIPVAICPYLLLRAGEGCLDNGVSNPAAAQALAERDHGSEELMAPVIVANAGLPENSADQEYLFT